MTPRVFLLCLAGLAIAARGGETAEPVEEVVLGGYSATPLTPELQTLLLTSLADEKLYSATVTARICAKELVGVRRQVVSGTNYEFTLASCDVVATLEKQNRSTDDDAVAKELGECSADMRQHCVSVESVVTVYEQSWTDTVEVSSIVVAK